MITKNKNNFEYPKSNIYQISNSIKKSRKDVDINHFEKHLVSTQMNEYRNALQWSKSTYNPVFYQLMQIYVELMRDSEVASTYNLLSQNIISRKFEIEDNETLTETLKDAQWFKDTINIILESQFFGYSVLAIDNFVDDVESVTNYERELYNPISRMLLSNKYGCKSGVSIDSVGYKNWYIDIVGDSKFEGILAEIAPYSILLKNVMLDWSSFIRRFSSPQPIIKSMSTDPDTIRSMTEYLSNIQSGTFGILNSMDEIEFISADNTNADNFEKLKNFLQAQIRKSVLGSESLGNEDSFVGSANISVNIFNTKVLANVDFIENILNNKIFPSLTKLGLIQYSGAKIKFDRTFEMSKQEQQMTIIELIKAGSGSIVLDKDFMEETFNVKISDIIIEDKKEDKKDGKSDAGK